MFVLRFFVPLFLALLLRAFFFVPKERNDGVAKVLLPGNAIYGFFFLIGFLEHCGDDIRNEPIACYSSGCTAAIVFKLGLTLTEVVEIAIDIDERWHRGEINTEKVLISFTESALDRHLDKNVETFLHDIEFIVSEFPSLQLRVRTAQTRDELFQLSKESSSIPFVTSSIPKWGDNIDGAFGVITNRDFKKRFEKTIEIPWIGFSKVFGHFFRKSFTIETAENAIDRGRQSCREKAKDF